MQSAKFDNVPFTYANSFNAFLSKYLMWCFMTNIKWTGTNLTPCLWCSNNSITSHGLRDGRTNERDTKCCSGITLRTLSQSWVSEKGSERRLARPYTHPTWRNHQNRCNVAWHKVDVQNVRISFDIGTTTWTHRSHWTVQCLFNRS